MAPLDSSAPKPFRPFSSQYFYSNPPPSEINETAELFRRLFPREETHKVGAEREASQTRGPDPTSRPPPGLEAYAPTGQPRPPRKSYWATVRPASSPASRLQSHSLKALHGRNSAVDSREESEVSPTSFYTAGESVPSPQYYNAPERRPSPAKERGEKGAHEAQAASAAQVTASSMPLTADNLCRIPNESQQHRVSRLLRFYRQPPRTQEPPVQSQAEEGD
jgi:hypothetical protein